MNDTPVLPPPGQRPICLACGKELIPNYQLRQMPFRLPRPLRSQWRIDNPLIFDGTYGRHKDSRFCTHRCGYLWAVAHTEPSPLRVSDTGSTLKLYPAIVNGKHVMVSVPED